MDNKDILTGYLAGRSIANNTAYELRKYREELEEISRFYANYLSEEKIADKVGNFILSENYDGAFEFLNNSLKGEIAHDCKNQKEFRRPLQELITERIEKYRPFYAKINREMPEMLQDMTAEKICEIMGVELMSPSDLAEYYLQKDEEATSKKISENLGLAFRIIIIVGLIALAIVASAS